MKVVLIGSGNVATVLGKVAINAGHHILQVAGRNEDAVGTLADMLKAKASNSFDDIDLDADIYIIAVSDNALPEVATSLRLGGKLVAHTTGAASKTVLRDVSSKYGVLYPLQSLRKEMPYLPIVPLLVDGNSQETTDELLSFAKTLSNDVDIADDEERMKLHVGAVLVSNFTNHLYALAEAFCKSENIPFVHLLPLINETAQRLQYASPSQTQTGPAVRGDTATIEKHLQLLENYPEIRELYVQISDSIARSK